MSSMPEVRAYERLEKIRFLRAEWLRVGETIEQMNADMAWIRSKGHRATGLSMDGFRYQSVYPDGTTAGWHWVEPGQWLVLMEGDGQDSEFDMPHAEGPDEYQIYPSHEWHEVPR